MRNRMRYPHADHQGSIIGISDYGGESAKKNTYSHFGEPNANNVGRFGYTGQVYLPELNMYYYKARIYYPQIGRFMQTDPVGYEDQMNLYAYVHNDPVNLVDPTGEAACGGICLGAGAATVWGYRAYKGYKAARKARAAAQAATALNETAENAENVSDRPSESLPVREGAEVERPGETGKRDEISMKPGGVDEANNDFDQSADPSTVKDRGNGMRTGSATNGNKITVRPGSNSGEPTVEVTRGSGKQRDTDKFRYRQP